MKICVLGNSHVASLKQGWDSLQNSYPGIELVFFASRGSDLEELSLHGSTLVPNGPDLAKKLAYTSGGKKAVEIAAYDLFLVYGLWLVLPRLDRRLSSAVKAQALGDAVTRSLNWKLFKLIRSASKAPIFIGHNPQRAIRQGHVRGKNFMNYNEIYELLLREFGMEEVRFLPQPAQTLQDGWHTRIELSQGSTRLDVGGRASNKLHPESDHTHMNGDYGRIFLEEFFSIISSENCAVTPTKSVPLVTRSFGVVKHAILDWGQTVERLVR